MMIPTETEKNLLCFLRVQKNPHQLITIRNSREGEVEHYVVQSEQKFIITESGIEQVVIKSK